MAPDAREVLEVGRVVATVARVVEEADRHRWHRRADHELAELAHNGAPVGVERSSVDGEAWSRYLASVDGLQRPALNDPRADIRPAAADVEEHIGTELLVHPVEALGRQRRAGGA